MRPNLVSFSHVPGNGAIKIVNISKARIVAIEKECSVLASSFQLVQNSVCIDVWAIIKGHGDAVWLSAAVQNHAIWQSRLALVYDMAG